MFKDIILGYYRSPSLGNKIQEYENKLKKDLRWWTFSSFAILFVFFTFFFSSLINSLNTPIKTKDFKSNTANPNLVYSISSTAKHNLKPGDIISYTLKIQNISDLPQKTNFEVNLGDVLEYADLVDGADYKESGDKIYWNQDTINAGQSERKIFAIKMKEKFPTLKKQGDSFDCIIKVNFGNELSYPVKCPVSKSIETLVDQLSSYSKFKTTTKNILFFVILFAISVYMTLRTNLLYKEIRYFKRHLGDFNNAR